MSYTGYIDIFLIKNIDGEEAIELINCYLNKGWTIDDHSKITYFIGEEYDYNRSDLENKENIFKLLKDAVNNKVKCGIALLDVIENTGGILSFTDESSLVFSISINKRYMSDGNTFDYNFYKNKLTACLADKIGSISFSYQ